MFKMDDFNLDSPMTPPPTPDISYSSIHYGLDYLEYQFIYRPPEPKKKITWKSSELPPLKLPHTLHTLYPDEYGKSKTRYANTSHMTQTSFKSTYHSNKVKPATILDFMRQ